MTTEDRFPFHPMTTKKIGDRVKVPRFATDETRGYHYGTVEHRPLRDELIVVWDQPIPYMGSKYSTIYPAILA